MPLVALLLLGTVGSVFVAKTMNDGISPSFQAVAAARVPEAETEPRNGRASTDTSPRLADALEAGIRANEGFLDENHTVRADSANQSVHFIVTGRTPQESTADAADMRDRYLLATAPAPIEARMDDVLSKAHVVREQLNALLPEPTVPSDPLVAAQTSLLNGQISLLTSESAQLSVEQVLADTDEEKAAIQEDIDQILAQIVALRTQLAALPQDSTGNLGGRAATGAATGVRESDPVLTDSNDALDDQFQIESLQSLYSNLLIEFQTLYIESTDGRPVQLPEIGVTDETPDPIPVPLAGGTGLIASSILAVGLILVDDRLRRKWWSKEDLGGVLAETPDRRIRGVEPWYWNTPASPRKLAIQKVAVNLLPSVEAGPVAVGVIGLAARSTALRAFSVDLAAIMVTTGRSTLVIDTTGLEENVGAEPWQLLDGPVVADLLNPWKLDIDDAGIAQAVVEARELWPGLAVIPSGGPSMYSIEGAMTPLSNKLLDLARQTFDLTLVPITERGTALTGALVRNLDAVLIVGHAGKTRIRDAERLGERLTADGTNVLGSVLLLRPTRRKLREVLSSARREPDTRVAPQVTPTPAPKPRGKATFRHWFFGRQRISKVLAKYSVSGSWKAAANGGVSNGLAKAAREEREIRDGSPDQPETDGNRTPRSLAALTSHPDARRRADVDITIGMGTGEGSEPLTVSVPERTKESRSRSAPK